jgi:phosphoglycerate dehydrogenase-like enzyme
MAARVIYIGAPEADALSFAARARSDFPGMELYATDDRDSAAEHLMGAEAIIAHHFQFDDALVRRARRLRWIQSLTSGTDAIVRLPSLAPEVVITSTRGIHGPQMSELVFLQMLALARDFRRTLDNQRERRWQRWPQPLLCGKTIVIVGIGAVAEALALRCQAFGMTALGVSGSDRRPPGFDRIFNRSDLPQAAALADFLVLTVPLTAETENLVDGRILSGMRPSAFLINVARGGVLDERALLGCLRAGRIAGAALDVFRQMPLPAGDPLWAEERLIVTPVLGGMSDVYLEQAYPLVKENIQCFLAGRLDLMVNVVQRPGPWNRARVPNDV